ncbi:MAG: EthD domain-containing protein [Sphingomonadaceae bacterium]
MEKAVYALWRDADCDREAFNEKLRGPIADQILAAGVRGLCINLVDRHVDRAKGLVQANSRPLMDAVVQIWFDCAHDEFRAPVDAILATAAPRVSAWLVTESQPIRNMLHPPQPGERTEGFSELVFLTRPAHLTAEGWRDIWHRSHTRVAIDTQSTFEYIQNTITRPLTYAAPPYDAMIEECFPVAAMDDPEAFYDARGNPEKFARNHAAMMESCHRFIDYKRIDVIPTSQYVVKPLS